MKISRNIALTLVCIILGIMIAWQYKSVNYNENIASFQSKRTEELMEQLIELQNTNLVMRARLQELQEENRKYESAIVGDTEAVENLKKQLEIARIFAGLVDVKGKGVIITLDNGELTDVEESDILDIINELRAIGAQAISINEERVVATTEVRQAGNYQDGTYILINGVRMKAPFVIKAISDPEKLERSLTMIGGVVEKLEKFGLKISIKQQDNIIIPKVRDDGSVLKYDMLTPVK